MSTRIGLLGVLILAMFSAGCAAEAVNPSFALSNDQARSALRAMAADPKPLERPLLIVNGYHDPGIGSLLVKSQLGPMIRDRRVVSVAFLFSPTFDDCREAMIAAVDRAFPSDDPDRTTEVDVIGISMGGLAARYAAVPRSGKRSLRMARLFTIASPLRGAELATLPTWDQRQIDMRVGSTFYRQLASAEPQRLGYELVPYVRLYDMIVGAANAAPIGRTAWWVPVWPVDLSHGGAPLDPRIIADIARRLRDEQPYTTDPPAPLPG